MARKKKAPVRAHKVRSRGVWIAPDLERTIKGERGRRGLTAPPYSYYLQLADIALKSSAPSSPDPTAIPLTVWPVLKSPKRPQLELPKPPRSPNPPRPIVPKPPKSDRSKPPKRGR
ncbi:MAG: hypothetical protein DMG61_08200, partial [Acidobacteria bacterium]